MAVLPGKTLERYELQNRIAVGGMAEVYRAVAYGAHGFEKTLAIKRILPELARDPEFEARFIAEAKLAVQLTHANIVQVLDFGRFAGTLFIAMEYVDGLDLGILLKRNRERDERVPIPAAFQIAIEITRGLDFAHQHGVVHRDVSPSNILLSRAGEVKIADFGIAQAVTERRVSRPSGRRKIMGKWRYMSPEQARGDDLTTRSDLFSAASVLFELFTGDKLFPGDEADQIISHIHDMEIPKASERRRGLPPRLDEILGRCLARDPDQRPSKPGEVVRALTEVSYESSIVATALDVAEAVRDATPQVQTAAEAAPPADRRAGIDELIRKQLGGPSAPPPGDNRRTAVDDAEPTTADDAQGSGERATHTATVVKKGVDADGLTVWELDGEGESSEDTIAAVPSAIRFGKSTGNHRALQAEDEPASAQGSRAGWWMIAVATLLVAAGGAGVWAVAGGERTEAVVIDAGGSMARSDAAPVGPAVTTATLILDSEPAGAQVWVDGDVLSEPTPTRAVVDAAVPHTIEISAPGYARWRLADVKVEPGKSFPIKPTLVAIRAGLTVTSDPSGAVVELEGEAIGQTPVTRNDLEPGRGQQLVVRKRGHQPARRSVDLVAGETAALEVSLPVQIVYGTVRIAVPGWAHVHFRGKKIATVPRQPVKLPVGKHVLELVNPPTGKKKTLQVEVKAGETAVYRVSW